MKEDITYIIGELLFTEMEEVKDISYPKGEKHPSSFTITLNNGSKYNITVQEG